MSIVVLKLPDVKRKTDTRPRQCPACEGELFQRWGRVEKPVRDIRVRRLRVYRYRCCHCGRTFRHYPAGSSPADQSERLKAFAVICWKMGMSFRSVSRMLSALQISLSHMTVWRDAQAEGARLRQQSQHKPVRILGLDGAWVRGWGDERPVLVAVDLGSGDPIAVGYVNEHDPQAVCRWLKPLIQQHGITVVVTDDLDTYRTAAKKLNLGHQVCQFHVRRWVHRALKELQQTVPKSYAWMLDEIYQILDVLPPDGSQRLYTLWRHVPGRRSKINQPRTPLEKLRSLIYRLNEHWSSYCAFQSEPEVPWTNNGTESAIGRMKMRARTVRGYKSWPGMQTGLLLAGSRNS